MRPTLSAEFLRSVKHASTAAAAEPDAARAGREPIRQPVHVIYGGAHLFRPDISEKLGRIALGALNAFANDPAQFERIFGLRKDLAATVHSRLIEKLTAEPVEDYRIDFEDGYGHRGDAEEDAAATSAAAASVQAMNDGLLPPFFGIRIKAIGGEAHDRAVRTLDIFLTELLERSGGNLPANFVITLPKVSDVGQVSALADIFDEFESQQGLSPGSLRMELMVETRRSLIAADGRVALPHLVEASRGRCRGLHFGAYDYTADCGITSADQDLLHPACDLARSIILTTFGASDVWIADGSTNIMPIAPHAGSELTAGQQAENERVVRQAWRLHFDHCRHSLSNGFFQSWDLHPAQLVSRYAAVYSFFLEGLDAAGQRLRNFVEAAARASLVGDVFDDAATGQGLINFFRRAVGCGALTEEEAAIHSGLTFAQIGKGSFRDIVAARINE